MHRIARSISSVEYPAGHDPPVRARASVGGASTERLLATLAGFFGALALLLAMIGLYGILS
jgi:hypothetical protein